MFGHGDKLWLCLAFYQLPLEALLFIKPLEFKAREKASEVHRKEHSLTGEAATETTSEVHRQGGSLTEEAATETTAEGYRKDLRFGPVAVLEKQRVLLANDAAAALGVRPGQAAATARTLVDGIRLLERDPAAEQRHLEKLCCWAYSLIPTLYPYRGHSLLLEVGSCMMLYGSVEALLSRVHSELSRRGYSYCYGLAPTPKAAGLFTRPLEFLTKEKTSEVHRQESSLTREPLESPATEKTSEVHRQESSLTGEPLEVRLGPLPLRLLEEFPREVDALARAGLWSFDDILTLPRRALARRCGRDFVHHLEQILGTAEDRAPDFKPPQQFVDDFWFGYEVKANQELLPAIQLLLNSLCRFLRNTQLQTQQVEWELYDINRRVQRLVVGSSQPQGNWQAWYQLTRLKIEQLKLDAGVEGIGLQCHQLHPGHADTADLFHQPGQREPLHSLLDRLKNRLGLQSVRKIACRDEHLPEFAGYSSPDTRITTTRVCGEALRPFWLMPEPQRLQEIAGKPCWNGRLALLDGPERIEDNWWEDAVSRDYYVARDKSGQQYWIYRDRLADHWYIQGVFHQAAPESAADD
jgi:protein ImuB